MRHLVLAGLMFFVALPIVAPQSFTPIVVAQPMLTRQHKDAIRQWVSVVRKCKTARVMWQVVDLMDDVCFQVEVAGQNDARKRIANGYFLGLLKTVRAAAKMKAQGLESKNSTLLNAAEVSLQRAAWLAS